MLYSERSHSGQRLFDEKAVDRVRLIQQLYSAGLSSLTIVEVLPCMDTGSLNAMQLGVLTTERDRIDGQISSLNEARKRLHDVIETAVALATKSARLRPSTSKDLPLTRT